MNTGWMIRSRSSVSRRLSTQTKVAIGVPSFLKPAAPADASLPPIFVAGGCLPPPNEPVQIRSRYGLPGNKDPLTNPRLPETLAHARPDFPRVLTAETPSVAGDDPKVGCQ